MQQFQTNPPKRKLKRKSLGTGLRDSSRNIQCLECGKKSKVVMTQGVHPFCSKTCADKRLKRVPGHAEIVAAPTLPSIQQNACKGCGLSLQALVGGFLLTHCSGACAKKWPLQLVRCAANDCEEFISGAYGQYCAVMHKDFFVTQNVLPPMPSSSRRWGRLNPLRVFGWHKPRILFYDKHDPYYSFTNFSPHSIMYNGRLYPTSEHLYQSLKFANTRPDIVERIRTCSVNPRVAFNEGRKYQRFVRPDWPQVKISMMELALFHKFTQHPYLTAELLSTGNTELVEDSPVDAFWGIGTNRKGHNELGKALMRLRQQLRYLA